MDPSLSDSCSRCSINTQRNIFEILLNQTQIRLYLTFSSIDLEQQTDTVRLLFQINLYMVNTIWFGFDLLRFRKYFSVCSRLRPLNKLILNWFLNWPLWASHITHHKRHLTSKLNSKTIPVLPSLISFSFYIIFNIKWNINIVYYYK